MFSIFTKKKLTEEKVANIFVNHLFDLVEEGFADVAYIINSDCSFETSPNVDPTCNLEFFRIVLAGNMSYVPRYFDSYQDKRVMDLILKNVAQAIESNPEELQQTVASYQSYMMKKNHPSKNMLYAMSKALFYKYNLNDFQQDYFRNMQSPNPIFLKKLDEIMTNFLFDWELITEDYRVVGA